MGGFAPPPAGVASPMVWGSEPGLVELFGPSASDIRTTRKMLHVPVPIGRALGGLLPHLLRPPTHKAFAALDVTRQADLHAALVDLLRRENTQRGDALAVPAEYVEVVVTK